MPEENPILRELGKIRESQQRLEQAVLGDPEIGLTGLVGRVERVEGKVKAHDHLLLKVTGGVTVVGAIVGYLLGR